MPLSRPSGISLVPTLIAALSLLSPSLHAQAQEWRSSAAERRALAVTVYQNDLALVRDQRTLTLPAGPQQLLIGDVGSELLPETVLLRSLGEEPPLRVLEQSYAFDLLTPTRLLERSVGRTVKVVRDDRREEEAVVLAARDGVVLKIGERIETGLPGRLIFGELPDRLHEQPTLRVTVDNPDAAPRNFELTYLTGGLTWQADYVAHLSTDGRGLDLAGWATVTNRSGVDYRQARLQLMAGSPQRVAADRAPRVLMAAMEKAATLPEESLGGYHLYSLPRPVDLEQQQTKQVSLLAARVRDARSKLLLRGQEHYYVAGSPAPAPADDARIESWLEFDNRGKSGLGLPLPGGVVRVYRQGRDGSTQFVGEDHIRHSADGDTLRLRLGEAFDVRAERVQTDFRKPNAPAHAPQFESAHRIVLRNANDAGVTVRVEEPIPGSWEMISATLPARKEAANLAVWEVMVAGRGETTLEYRVRVRY